MEYKKIYDDIILNLEIIHDNDDLSIYKKDNTAYDFINRKKFNIEIDIQNPEQVMKELLFHNIEYGSLHITNKNFENEAIGFNKNIIFVFDNKQFTKEVMGKCQKIYKQDKLTIFIPFIYLAELLLNNTNSTIKAEKEKIINEYGKICNLIFDDYYDYNNKVKDFYKKEIDNIGLYYNNKNDRLINYNDFSKNKEFNSDKIIDQINIIYKFINNFNINPSEKDINNLLNNVKNEITPIIKEKNIKNSQINDKLLNTYKFAIGIKESRDTYYMKEINKMKKKYNNHNFVYVAMDEISNCRCVLEKISSLNIYNTIPRYIIHIENNKVILKLFNIYHKLTPTNYDIIKINEEYNSGIILKNSKALISKIIVGGFRKNMINNQELEQMIKNKNYELIKNYIIDTDKKLRDLFYFLYEDKYKTIEEIAKKNNIYVDKVNNVIKILYELIYLYNSTALNELINNLKFTEDQYRINVDFKIGLSRIDEFYYKYKSIRNKEINKIDWEILYFVTIFEYYVDFKNRKKDLEFYKHIFPEIFNYPIEEFIILYNYLDYRKELEEKKELEDKMNE